MMNEQAATVMNHDADSSELFRRLDRMYSPRSVAVIGASDVPGKWGFLLVTNIIGGNFNGQLYPVNPGKEEILGVKTYPSVKDIPGEVDLAILTIPAKRVAAALQDCVDKKVGAVVVITSGFREVGGEGVALETEITDLAREHGLVFLGPNTMGIVSQPVQLTAVGAPVNVSPGKLAIISQSGNIGVQFMEWSRQRGIGLGFFAGTGNESNLRTADLLRYFGSRDDVQAIAIYAEGITGGRDFMEAAREVTPHKPVVALKTGRSAVGAKAASSHTGSLAGSHAAYSAMFTQVGIMQARTPSELINVAGAMAHLPVPRSNRVAIMSIGGGWGVITADECNDAGLELPDLPQDIIDKIDKILPPFWNRSNPVDLVGEGEPEISIPVMETLLEWDEVDAVIALGVVGRVSLIENMVDCQRKIEGTPFSKELKSSILKEYLKRERQTNEEMARLQEKHGKPVVAVTLGAQSGRTLVDTPNGEVLNLSSPEEAANILSHMSSYRRYLNRIGK